MTLSAFRKWLGLERNVLAMLAAILLVGMGEELWVRFVPKYLEVLGAGTAVIAAYGALKDLLDSLYQYPGGWMADRFGRRFALILSCLLAIAGYFLYLIAGNGLVILVGTLFVMAWSSLTLPAFFTMIADNLPADLRATGFGVQSFLKRIPIIIAPPLGGWMLAHAGFLRGMRWGLILTIFLSLVSIYILRRFYRERPDEPSPNINALALFQSMNPRLKKLLVADCLARWAEGIPKVFIVLYVLNELRLTEVQFGWLISLQMFVSMASYIPVAKVADRMNRKPFVLLTFLFFSLFPLAIVQGTGWTWIVVAFVIGGLREIGEPARKAFIVDHADAGARGRAVGLYYLLRGFIVFPASLVGGLLWKMDPTLPFYVAFSVGAIGCAVYALTTDPERKPLAIDSP